MFDATATGAETLVSSLTGDAEMVVPFLLPMVERLGEIEDLLADADEGPSKSETIKAAEEQKSPALAVYLAKKAEMDAAYAALYSDVWGSLPESEADVLKAEAGTLGKKVKQTVTMIETTMGETGFVNTFMAICPKPEGSRLRAFYKNF